MDTHHTITGGGGVQLHVVETGNPKGRPILFLHGTSQCWLSWSRQLNSDLANDYRLLAMDLRGHGLSDKPRDAYGESKAWADDVNAAIETLKLDHPVLSGSSYGPLVFLDYIRHYGEDRIAGIHLVGGITQLGTEEAMTVLSPDFISLVPGLFATDVEESFRTLSSLVRLCLVEELSVPDLYLMMGFNLSVPPYVRQGMFSRQFNNNDLLPKLRKPVLITHGAKDAVVKPEIVNQHKAGMKHAQVHLMADAGHAPFWDDPTGFNQRLRTFRDST
jgi:pimeloyl-ACP methyl ester carboxylesterase